MEEIDKEKIISTQSDWIKALMKENRELKHEVKNLKHEVKNLKHEVEYLQDEVMVSRHHYERKEAELYESLSSRKKHFSMSLL